MTNGIMKNPDLVLDSPNLKAEGAGTVDLPTRTVDYKVTPKVAGLGVPVLIKGPWDNLSYLPDLAGILKGGVGGAADIVKGGAGGVTNTLKGIVPGAGGSSSGSGTSGGAAPKSGSGSGGGGLPNPIKGLFGN
jgi:AsmA protein